MQDKRTPIQGSTFCDIHHTLIEDGKCQQCDKTLGRENVVDSKKVRACVDMVFNFLGPMGLSRIEEIAVLESAAAMLRQILSAEAYHSLLDNLVKGKLQEPIGTQPPQRLRKFDA